MKRHRVRQGECIASIARLYGFFPETLWSHAENAELRERRASGYVLMPGDEVFIPNRVPLTTVAETDRRHRFVRRGIPEYLRLVLRDADGAPQASVDYEIEIDGQLRTGTTDGDGLLELPIPPGAARAVLRFPAAGTSYELPLGHLDPITTVSGVQARLNNLGYPCKPIDGEWREDCRRALAQFQAAEGLPATGEIDDASREALLAEHRS